MEPADEPIRPGVCAAGAALLLGAAAAFGLIFRTVGGDAASQAGAPAQATSSPSRLAGPLGPRDAGPAPGPGLRAQAYGGAPGVSGDPQLAAMFRTVGGDAGLAPFAPRTWSGRLTHVRGAADVAEGDRCELRVLPVRTQLFNCLVRVTCGGVVLYPDRAQRAGYAPCEVRDEVPTRAEDDGTTPQDGDPRLHVDLLARRARVADESEEGSFEAEIALDARL